MPRVILLAALLVAAVIGVRALIAGVNRLDREKRRRLGRGVLVLVGLTVAILVLARFGLQWLGVIGGAAWAVLRALLPALLKLLPMGHYLRQRWARVGPTPPRDRATNDARARGMSRAEALEVLGLDEGSSKEQVLHAYRNLIRKVHPDAPGGSAYLATKLNQAKDVLLS